MASVRVRLQFPDDEKYWIYIDHSYMKTVKDVVDSINEKFSVCCEKLVLDDAQLPWMESISLIQERDILCVHFASTKKKRKPDDSKPESALNDLVSSIDLSHPFKKKKKSSEDKFHQKTIDLSLLETQENTHKVRKKKVSPEQSELDEQNRSSCTQNAILEAIQLQSTSCDEVHDIGIEDTSKRFAVDTKHEKEQTGEHLSLANGLVQLEQNNQTLDNSVSEGNEEETTRRRRRRRKRKSHHKEEVSLNVQAPPVPVDYVPLHPIDRKHIRFDNAQQKDIGTPGPVEKAVQVKSNTEAKSKHLVQLFPDDQFDPFYKDKSNTKPTSPLKSNHASASKTNVLKPIGTPTVSNQSTNGNLNGSPFGALLSLRSAVFTRNAKSHIKPTESSYNNVPPPDHLASSVSSSYAKDPKIDESIGKTETLSSQTLDFTKFPLCPGPPRVNDVIAFKILELSDNYNPEVSEYIRGRITSIGADGELIIELLEPRAKRHTFGKFELYQNDEEDIEEAEVEMETSMSCQWTQLIEPRLIFP